MPVQLIGAALALALASGLAGCGSPCPAGGATPGALLPQAEQPPGTTDSEHTAKLIEAAERFANQTCACTSPVCTDSATRDFIEWLRAHPRREGTPVAAKRVMVAMEKMLLCRDRLAYPDDPVDLEASAPPGA